MTRTRSFPVSFAVAVVTTLAMVLVTAPGMAATQQETQVRTGGNPDAYKFLAKVNGVPIHWDKCKVIRYRISTYRLPGNATWQVREAARRVAGMSGLRLRYVGTTKTRPYVSSKYPKGTRLVIGWLRPRESKALPAGAAGVGGPQWSGTGEILKGFVQINSRKHGIANGFGRGPKYGSQGTKGQLLMHELGHAVGLQHVRDPHQIMYPALTRKYARWGRGDANGLRRVGKLRKCF